MSADRAALKRLLAAVKSSPRPFDVLLVDDTSRLSRNQADVLRIHEQLAFAGIRFVAVSQGIDSEHEQADLMVGVHGIFDQLYVKELAKKTHRGLEGLALRGLHTGGRICNSLVSALLLAICDSFACQDTSELQILKPFFDVQYLLLDELGDICLDGDRTASSFAASRILALLDKRFQNGGKTLITSNLSLENLTSWTGDERIGSRLRGLCGEQGIVELEGRDLRFDSMPEGASTR